MSDMEITLARMFGASTFLVYSYLKRVRRGSTLDITLDTGLSDKTVIKGLRQLAESKVIDRKMVKYNVREVTINNENNWKLQ